MIVFVLILLISILFLMIVLFLFHIEGIQAENHRMESYILSMRGVYATLYDRIEATRRYRHDLAKHIQTLEVMLSEQENQNEGMQTYIDDLKKRYVFYKKEKFCVDELVNAMLSVKDEECKRKGIPFQVEIEDAIYTEVQEVDMVGLLYNLLDNAVEANERIVIGEKGIAFSMQKKDGKLYLCVENQISKGEKIDFRTKKKKADEHGFGTKIIAGIVKKYHGTADLEIDAEKQIMRQRIVLQNLAKEEE